MIQSLKTFVPLKNPIQSLKIYSKSLNTNYFQIPENHYFQVFENPGFKIQVNKNYP